MAQPVEFIQLDAAALIELANERSEQAHEVFCKFDADGSGYLGFRELGQALRALFKQAGLKKTPDFATLEEQFGKADTNGDNQVSPEEFVAWYNHAVEWTRRLQAEAEAAAVFFARLSARGAVELIPPGPWPLPLMLAATAPASVEMAKVARRHRPRALHRLNSFAERTSRASSASRSSELPCCAACCCAGVAEPPPPVGWPGRGAGVDGRDRRSAARLCCCAWLCA